MNTRNRVISAAQILFCGPSPATGSHSGNITQLHRVQSCNYSFDIPREDVVQFGNLAPIDRFNLEPPTVSLDFSYLVTDIANEEKLGFTVNSVASILSGILTRVTDERNYFILTVPEGNDANGFTAGSGSVIGIGNGFLSRYGLEASVGGFATANVTVEGLNIVGYASGIAQNIPAVNSANGLPVTGVPFTLPAGSSGEVGQVTALRPGDISLNLGNSALFVDLSGISVQSFSCGFDLAREGVRALGYKFFRSRELQFPINVSLQTEVLAGDLTTGNLANVLCADTSYDMTITMRQPDCEGDGAVAAQIDLRGVKLESQNWQQGIGSNGTVSLNWVAQLSGPQDVANGLFMSGVVQADY